MVKRVIRRIKRVASKEVKPRKIVRQAVEKEVAPPKISKVKVTAANWPFVK